MARFFSVWLGLDDELIIQISLHLFFFSSIKRYEEDVWTEIAKFLDGKSLLKLSLTCRWFRRLLTEESIWKHACLRDLQVPDPRQVGFKWSKLYASAFGKMAFFIHAYISIPSSYCST